MAKWYEQCERYSRYRCHGLFDIGVILLQRLDSSRPAIVCGDPACSRGCRGQSGDVGDLVLDKEGIAVRGLLVRHLVLPGNLSSTDICLEFLAKEVSPDIYLSLMAQYHPCYLASGHAEINRLLTKNEYDQAVKWAEEVGIHRGYFQHLSSSNVFLPDFKKEKPFEP